MRADFRNYTYAEYGRRILAQPQRRPFNFRFENTALLRAEYRIREVTKAELPQSKAGEEARTTRKAGSYRAGVHAAVQPGEFNPAFWMARGPRKFLPENNWLCDRRASLYGICRATGITFTSAAQGLLEGKFLDTENLPIQVLWSRRVVGGLFYSNYPGGSGLMSARSLPPFRSRGSSICNRTSGTGSAGRSGEKIDADCPTLTAGRLQTDHAIHSNTVSKLLPRSFCRVDITPLQIGYSRCPGRERRSS